MKKHQQNLHKPTIGFQKTCCHGYSAIIHDCLLASDPGPQHHRIYDRQEEGLGKPPCLENKGLRLDLLRFRKSFTLRSSSTGTCYPGSILKVLCSKRLALYGVACSLVSTLVLFSNCDSDQVSPLQGPRKTTTGNLNLARKASSAFLGLLPSWQTEHTIMPVHRLQHGMAQLSELRRCLARMQIWATLVRRSGALLGRNWYSSRKQEIGLFKKKKRNKKQEKEEKTHFVQSGLQIADKRVMTSESKSLRPYLFNGACHLC